MIDRLPKRIATRVMVSEEGCWRWTGPISSKGYGKSSMGGLSTRYAHRVVYHLLVGPIPAGLELDHLCRRRCCVNPAHLEPVTGRENRLRGSSPNYVTHVTKVCQRGHQIVGLNDYRGRCRECRNESARRYTVLLQRAKGTP